MGGWRVSLRADHEKVRTLTRVGWRIVGPQRLPAERNDDHASRRTAAARWWRRRCFGAQMSAMLGGLGGLGGAARWRPQEDPLDEMFGEEKAKEKAAKMGEGVTVGRSRSSTRTARRAAASTYAFKDINKLKLGSTPEWTRSVGWADREQGKRPRKPRKDAESGAVQFADGRAHGDPAAARRGREGAGRRDPGEGRRRDRRRTRRPRRWPRRCSPT